MGTAPGTALGLKAGGVSPARIPHGIRESGHGLGWKRPLYWGYGRDRSAERCFKADDLLLLSLQSREGVGISPQHEIEVSSPWSVVTGPRVTKSFKGLLVNN